MLVQNKSNTLFAEQGRGAYKGRYAPRAGCDAPRAASRRANAAKRGSHRVACWQRRSPASLSSPVTLAQCNAQCTVHTHTCMQMLSADVLAAKVYRLNRTVHETDTRARPACLDQVDTSALMAHGPPGSSVERVCTQNIFIVGNHNCMRDVCTWTL